MCDCSKQIKQTDCDRLKEFNNDPEKRFFIYHIFDDFRGLQVAYVPNGINPNQIALERGFIDQNDNAKWFSTLEHPCLND